MPDTSAKSDIVVRVDRAHYPARVKRVTRARCHATLRGAKVRMDSAITSPPLLNY